MFSRLLVDKSRLENPFPTLSQCYEMLLQDKNQRDVHVVTGINSNNVAMNVRSNIHCKFVSKGTSGANSQNSGGFLRKNNSDSSLIYNFCHMQ